MTKKLEEINKKAFNYFELATKSLEKKNFSCQALQTRYLYGLGR